MKSTFALFLSTVRKVLAVLPALALSWGSASASRPVVPISPREGLVLLKAGKAVIIDVRELDEIKEGKVLDAKWIPLSGLQEGSAEVKKSVEQLDRGKELLLYCHSGNRSDKAGRMLQDQGFKARNLGGYDDLKAAGYEVGVPGR